MESRKKKTKITTTPQELRKLEEEFAADVRLVMEDVMRTPEHDRPPTPLPELPPNQLDDDAWMGDDEEVITPAPSSPPHKVRRGQVMWW